MNDSATVWTILYSMSLVGAVQWNPKISVYIKGVRCLLWTWWFQSRVDEGYQWYIFVVHDCIDCMHSKSLLLLLWPGWSREAASEQLWPWVPKKAFPDEQSLVLCKNVCFYQSKSIDLEETLCQQEQELEGPGQDLMCEENLWHISM